MSQVVGKLLGTKPKKRKRKGSKRKKGGGPLTDSAKKSRNPARSSKNAEEAADEDDEPSGFFGGLMRAFGSVPGLSGPLYSIQIHVIEGKDLNPASIDSMASPMCQISIRNQVKSTRKHLDTFSPLFDEVISFQIPLRETDLEKGRINLEVFDTNSKWRNTLIGQFWFDIPFIYGMNSHSLLNQWVALFNNKKRNQGVQGYLKLSLCIFGPTDKQPASLEEMEKRAAKSRRSKEGDQTGEEGKDHRDDQDDLISSEDPSNVMLPPFLNYDYEKLTVTIIQTRDLPNITPLKLRNSTVPYYMISLDFGPRTHLESTVKPIGSNAFNPLGSASQLTHRINNNDDVNTQPLHLEEKTEWNVSFIIPVREPNFRKSLTLTIHQQTPSDFRALATLNLSYNEIKQGIHSDSRWYNMYGSQWDIQSYVQMDQRRSKKDSKKTSLLESCYCGKVLLNARISQQKLKDEEVSALDQGITVERNEGLSRMKYDDDEDDDNDTNGDIGDSDGMINSSLSLSMGLIRVQYILQCDIYQLTAVIPGLNYKIRVSCGNQSWHSTIQKTDAKQTTCVFWNECLHSQVKDTETQAIIDSPNLVIEQFKEQFDDDDDDDEENDNFYNELSDVFVHVIAYKDGNPGSLGKPFGFLRWSFKELMQSRMEYDDHSQGSNNNMNQSSNTIGPKWYELREDPMYNINGFPGLMPGLLLLSIRLYTLDDPDLQHGFTPEIRPFAFSRDTGEVSLQIPSLMNIQPDQSVNVSLHINGEKIIQSDTFDTGKATNIGCVLPGSIIAVFNQQTQEIEHREVEQLQNGISSDGLLLLGCDVDPNGNGNDDKPLIYTPLVNLESLERTCDDLISLTFGNKEANTTEESQITVECTKDHLFYEVTLDQFVDVNSLKNGESMVMNIHSQKLLLLWKEEIMDSNDQSLKIRTVFDIQTQQIATFFVNGILCRSSPVSPSHLRNNTTNMLFPINNENMNQIVYGARVQLQDPSLGSGVVRFVGKTKFSNDEIIAGIELDHPRGKHDGCFDDQRYFLCHDKHGMFVPLSKISGFIGDEKGGIESTIIKYDISNFTNEVRIGDDIEVEISVQSHPSAPRMKRMVRGTLKFVGRTHFGGPTVLCGVELAEPLGMNDGSKDTIRYFSAKPDLGVFLPLTAVKTRLTQHIKVICDEYGRTMTLIPVRKQADISVGDRVISAFGAAQIRFIGPTQFGDAQFRESQEQYQRSVERNKGKPAGPKPKRPIYYGLSLLRPMQQTGKYAGTNDGSLNQTRYFQCKPNRGVFCRFAQITHQIIKFPELPIVETLPINVTSGSFGIQMDNVHIHEDISVVINRDNNNNHGGSSSSSLKPFAEATLSLIDFVNRETHMMDGTDDISHSSLIDLECILQCKPPKMSTLIGKSSVISSIAKEWQIGDRVLIANRGCGEIKFIGSVQFTKESPIYGVHLDQAKGTNNGSKGGTLYFSCPNGHGIFVSAKQLKPEPSLDKLNDPSQTAFPIDSRVQVKMSGDHTSSELGTVRFVGLTHFAPGTLIFGVQLDHPRGKNDGSVEGTRYFRCKPNYGLFVTESSLTKPANDHFKLKLSSSNNGGINQEILNDPAKLTAHFSKFFDHVYRPSSIDDIELGMRVVIGGQIGQVKFIGQTGFSKTVFGEQYSQSSILGFEMENRDLKQWHNGHFLGESHMETAEGHGHYAPFDRIQLVLSKSKFNIGDRIELNNGKKGQIKYIGELNSDDQSNDQIGLFLGIDLDPRFRGSSDGNPYFEASSPKRGLFARPTQVARVMPTLEEANQLLGCYVSVKSKCNGRVKFVGRVPWMGDDIMLGVDLDEELGTNDGTGKDGEKYFECEKGRGYGLFIDPSQTSKLSTPPSSPAKSYRQIRDEEKKNEAEEKAAAQRPINSAEEIMALLNAETAENDEEQQESMPQMMPDEDYYYAPDDFDALL